MKTNRRTLTWVAVSAVPVLAAFAFADKNFVSTHQVRSIPSAYPTSSVARRVRIASASGRHYLHLKRGHTYQLSMTQMASVVGGDTGGAPGSTFTMAASYGTDGESTGSFRGWYLDDGSGPSYNSGSAAAAGGWVVHTYNSTAQTITITVSPSATPGSSYFAFIKTGTKTISSPNSASADQMSPSPDEMSPIGGDGPEDFGYQTAYFSVD